MFVGTCTNGYANQQVPKSAIEFPKWGMQWSHSPTDDESRQTPLFLPCGHELSFAATSTLPPFSSESPLISSKKKKKKRNPYFLTPKEFLLSRQVQVPLLLMHSTSSDPPCKTPHRPCPSPLLSLIKSQNYIFIGHG